MDSNQQVDLMMKLILAYAAILSIVGGKQLKQDQTSFIYDVIKNADSTGISFCSKYLESQVDISDIQKQLVSWNTS